MAGCFGNRGSSAQMPLNVSMSGTSLDLSGTPVFSRSILSLSVRQPNRARSTISVRYGSCP